jgi:hypothetical protein
LSAARGCPSNILYLTQILLLRIGNSLDLVSECDLLLAEVTMTINLTDRAAIVTGDGAGFVRQHVANSGALGVESDLRGGALEEPCALTAGDWARLDRIDDGVGAKWTPIRVALVSRGRPMSRGGGTA